MNKYIKYLKYVLRHKWFVMQECFERGFYWRGIMHDMSKFLPNEFIPYANYFYGEKKPDYNGFHKPGSDRDFDIAWLKHINRNPHHWQYWVLREDQGATKLIEMPCSFAIEMLCDWVGASKAQGHFSPEDDKYFATRNWYETNKDKMQLDGETRRWLEYVLRKYEYETTYTQDESGSDPAN